MPNKLPLRRYKFKVPERALRLISRGFEDLLCVKACKLASEPKADGRSDNLVTATKFHHAGSFTTSERGLSASYSRPCVVRSYYVIIM
jgi:hypothetical protein